jgi:hypothetical protein
MQERVKGEKEVGSYGFDIAEKAEDSYASSLSPSSSIPRLSIGR